TPRSVKVAIRRRARPRSAAARSAIQAASSGSSEVGARPAGRARGDDSGAGPDVAPLVVFAALPFGDGVWAACGFVRASPPRRSASGEVAGWLVRAAAIAAFAAVRLG